MQITFSPLDLRMRHPFGIARWTKSETRNVLVRVEHGGIVGLGEGAPNARYGESQASALRFLEALGLGRLASPGLLADVVDAAEREGREAAARSALDMALQDWLGRSAGRPLYDLWHTGGPAGPVTSFTIGIDTPERVREKCREAAPYRILKIKLGSDHDRELVEAVRSVTDRPLRVDANEGWKTKEDALRQIEWLAGQGVELVEQPLPAGRIGEMAWLKARSPLPLVADEDASGAAAMERLADGFHGVNVKLDKCGGLRAARALIGAARGAGLQVMLGCMVASSLAITAAAHLAPGVEWADLDGHLLLADDPFEGVRVEDGRLRLPEAPGLGVTERRHPPSV